jgi:hypothetical protein
MALNVVTYPTPLRIYYLHIKLSAFCSKDHSFQACFDYVHPGPNFRMVGFETGSKIGLTKWATMLLLFDVR